MAQYIVILYDFLAKPPSASLPETVDAPDPLSAVRQFLDEPLEKMGHFANLAAEVKRFEGTMLAERVMLYRKPQPYRAAAR
jgi:hypothetical protein